MNKLSILFAILLCVVSAACSEMLGPEAPGPGAPSSLPLPDLSRAETATVTQVIDGDTIDVRMNGATYRVRYVGVNTPERDEACYSEARAANVALVNGQQIRMLRDQSDTDQYGRLLRYIFVGERFVNAELIANGWAEAVEYAPDRRFTADFRRLEREATATGAGCHPTGIFDDGSDVR
jgi:micrococcal nuclease